VEKYGRPKQATVDKIMWRGKPVICFRADQDKNADAH